MNTATLIVSIYLATTGMSEVSPEPNMDACKQHARAIAQSLIARGYRAEAKCEPNVNPDRAKKQ